MKPAMAVSGACSQLAILVVALLLCSSAMMTVDARPIAQKHVWSWEKNDTLCAFKNDQQQPLPITKAYNMLSFEEAPACMQDPVPTSNNSMPDSCGCLWGWQLDRNCAFKNSSDAQPLYYPDYQQLCNTTDSALAAAEFNAKAVQAEIDPQFSIAEGENVVLDAPAVATGFGIVGQKQPLPVSDFAMSEADSTEPSGPAAPFSISVVPADFGPEPEPTPAPSVRRLSQVANPRFPKEKLPTASVSRPITGLACVTPPGHLSRGSTNDAPCLPEATEPQVVVAEGAVDHAPVADVPGSGITGPGGFGGPGLFSGWNGDATRTPVQTPDLGSLEVKASEGINTAAQSTILSVGHSYTPMAPSRRRLSSMDDLSWMTTVATAVATAVSSSDSSAEGPAVAISTAISTGNSSALAVSNATSNSTVNATAIATDGHKAVAELEASKGSCVLSVVVVNNKVTWHCKDPAELQPPASPRPATNSSGATPQHNTTGAADNATLFDSLALMWEDAQACSGAPNKSNSVPDASNRLWGYDLAQARPCAYKQPDGTPLSYSDYIAVKFETAPACEASPTAATSMTDAQLRLWGWVEKTGELCAFKDPSTGEPIYLPAPELPAESSNTTNSAHQVSPSAAGPTNGTGDGGNSTKPSTPGNGTSFVASEGVKGSDKQGPPEPQDSSLVVQAAEAQAKVVSGSINPNSTRADIALASARAAIIYQAAYEAAAASGEEPVIKAAEANTPSPSTLPLPSVLLHALTQTVLRK